MLLRSGVNGPEGPVCLPDGSWIITEMGSGFVSRVSADGRTHREIAYTGRPSGAAFRSDGSLYIADSKQRAVLQLTLDGTTRIISKGSPDLPFLWPNDLCFGPDGCIYLTDSGALIEQIEGIQPPAACYQQEIDGRIFQIDPNTGTCALIDRGLLFTNGIAFGPSGKYLYANETYTGNIYRYKVEGGKISRKRELFANVMIKPPIDFGQAAGPDGMAFDIEGNLYVAVFVQGDIAVLGPDGSLIYRIPIEGLAPTNVAFARPGERRLLVTECGLGQLWLLDVPTDGLPLYL
jgi:gluconolactonase